LVDFFNGFQVIFEEFVTFVHFDHFDEVEVQLLDFVNICRFFNDASLRILQFELFLVFMSDFFGSFKC
jgi:hypothetical protein